MFNKKDKNKIYPPSSPNIQDSNRKIKIPLVKLKHKDNITTKNSKNKPLKPKELGLMNVIQNIQTNINDLKKNIMKTDIKNIVAQTKELKELNLILKNVIVKWEKKNGIWINNKGERKKEKPTFFI